MLRFILVRLASAVPTLLLVIAVAFLMVRAAPGGPFDAERVLPPETAANLAAAYHLDEPLPVQFARYLGGVLRGDLGPSYYYRDYEVQELIAAALPVTALLAGLAAAVALVVGLAAGACAALTANSGTDRLVTGLAMTGISVPVFVIAPLMVLAFAVHLGWFPASWTGGGRGERLVLPVIALALPHIAFLARLTRGSLLEVLSADFIRAARAQGLGTWRVLRVHALKPALLPVVSYLGPALASLLTGAVVVEAVFGIPGLGQLFVRSGLNRDYTLVLGIVIFYAALIIVLNLVVDLVYGWLDPRVRAR
ncbi:MAG TPA: ABC transporter permease subunit [Woeseiaceae bacterium]|nr:ABC transporter permease subunit [Woeseiaceae bacterium]